MGQNLIVGDRVVLRHDNYDEYGVVVSVWKDEFEVQDCLVCFWGSNKEASQKCGDFYILRYFATSLEKL
jgi:hypothetical protein